MVSNDSFDFGFFGRDKSIFGNGTSVAQATNYGAKAK